MRIALATDHAGYDLMPDIKQHLTSMGHQFVDCGPSSLDVDDDYPQFMFKAAAAVSSRQCELGIILGGSGEGEAMAANRIKGIRCALFYGPQLPKGPVDSEGHTDHDPYEILKLSKLHNDANMLSLAARFLDLDEIKQAINIWLNTSFSGLERHQRRIDQLDA